MLWYLLAPLRGTTHPPRLSPTHPVRRAFYRHGKATARHWLLMMLFSVAVAMVFTYPTVLLSGNPTAGLAAHPHQVWTSARMMSETRTEVDLEMRQIYVHGSYMQALSRTVLQHGLSIQDSLLGDLHHFDVSADKHGEDDTVHIRWGFHSPLMYWNNSAQTLDDDKDLLRTINEQKHHSSSSMNVVLRHASVFAGKRFQRRKLEAADALVITLINQDGDSIASVWEDKMTSLGHSACPNCTFFPTDGHLARHKEYEFSFRALTFRENAALAFAYGCMAIYVLLSLRRMKAFHSRFGLAVTAITQMTFSILASFTICGILHINLAMIPQNAYPFVVLVIGLENMFRLINAVLAYPPTMATDLRIANALGDIGPLSVATAAQNLIILALLSMVVSPGVAAFCAFAAIATLFDVFFLLSFFVAVLNVDIRRLELQDTIAARQQNAPRHRRRPSPSQNTWFDALMSGRLPFSTRMAGTAVTTTFILSLNYHFFERGEMASGLRQLFGFAYTSLPNLSDLDTFAPSPVNASLTPGEWMRMQDFDAAKEVMKLARTSDDAFTMRIFAPLIVVLPESDRSQALHGRDAWTSLLRSFTIHHFYPVAVAVVFGVAFVFVLMNFLLYSDPIGEDTVSDVDQIENRLTVSTVTLPHRLDIVKLASHENGHVVAAALDRTITITSIDGVAGSTQTAAVPSEILSQLRWPIYDLAISEDGSWIACHCADSRIMLYNHRIGPTSMHYVPCPDERPVVVFQFVQLLEPLDSNSYFIALTSAGRLTMSCLHNHQLIGNDISTATLAGAIVLHTTERGHEILALTDDRKVLSFAWISQTWQHASSLQLDADPLSEQSSMAALTSVEMTPDHKNGLMILTTPERAIILDLVTYANVATFQFPDTKTGSSRLMLGPGRKCSLCGGIGFRQLGVAQVDARRNQHSLTVWSLDGSESDDTLLCLSRGSTNCIAYGDGVKDVQEFGLAGAWVTTKGQHVLGLRKGGLDHEVSVSRTNKALVHGLKERRRARVRSRSQSTHDQIWEAYQISLSGGLDVAMIGGSATQSTSSSSSLYVSDVGPIVAIADQAIVVAFGNTLQVIRASRHGSAGRSLNMPSVERKPSLSKRRGGSRKQR